jgi:uncharacterized protein DUF5317
MLLFLVPLVLALLAMMLGGRPEKLAALPFRAVWLVVIAFGTQWIVVRIPGRDPAPLLGGAVIASYTMLLGFLWLNRRVPGLKLALAGTLLNLAVLTANGGFMPVAPATLAAAHLERPNAVIGQRVALSKDILLPPDRAVLADLGDRLTIPWPIPQALSIGDLLVATGVGWLVLAGMEPRLRGGRRRNARQPGTAVPAGTRKAGGRPLAGAMDGGATAE